MLGWWTTRDMAQIRKIEDYVYGIWYESRNNSPWKYKFKKSLDKSKNLIRDVHWEMKRSSSIDSINLNMMKWAHQNRSYIYDTLLRNHQGRNPSSFGLGVSAWWLLRGFWLNRIHDSVFIIMIKRQMCIIRLLFGVFFVHISVICSGLLIFIILRLILSMPSRIRPT